MASYHDNDTVMIDKYQVKKYCIREKELLRIALAILGKGDTRKNPEISST
jgi:hypothetical protein